MPSCRKNSGREGKCEGKKTTLTLTLTPFITVCQPVTAKSEGVRVKNKKNFFNRTARNISIMYVVTLNFVVSIMLCIYFANECK